MNQRTGRCRGGPFNSKLATHHGSIYRLGFDTNNPLRALPGQQGPSLAEPCVSFGSYVWFEAISEWVWDEKSVSETR